MLLLLLLQVKKLQTLLCQRRLACSHLLGRLLLPLLQGAELRLALAHPLLHRRPALILLLLLPSLLLHVLHLEVIILPRLHLLVRIWLMHVLLLLLQMLLVQPLLQLLRRLL